VFPTTLHAEIKATLFALKANSSCTSGAVHCAQISPIMVMVVNISYTHAQCESRTFELAQGSNFTMATGDLKNNLMKLLREMKRMKLDLEPDIQGYEQ
jgi:hypothetical protein